MSDTKTPCRVKGGEHARKPHILTQRRPSASFPATMDGAACYMSQAPAWKHNHPAGNALPSLWLTLTPASASAGDCWGTELEGPDE